MPHPTREVSDQTRRQFLTTSAAAAGLLALGAESLLAAGSAAVGDAGPAAPARPWYRRCLRWGQTNIVEIDPARYDLTWWRQHWKRTRIQGVVLNAGGIVAYYPTEVPLHRRAAFLGDRDLFGELRAAAREDGLAVFARMDSNRADEAFFRTHPDWFARDAAGQPYRATGLYIACVNSPYYRGHIPAILREVATRYRPEGFTDNNWNGPMRDQPCHCATCERLFRARTGAAIPRAPDWESELYREWILWNYERRLEIWDEFNRVTREAGGPECLWVGMMAGSQNWQARVFRDDREIYRRTELIMLDHQRRFDSEGFQHNAETGRRLLATGGWDKVIPESMAMYHLTEHNFRLATKPVPEVRLWAVEAFAGGIQPWWHHVGADQHDRRMFDTAEPLWRWHEKNEAVLVNRRPVAVVGLLWSQRNMDFYGRDDGGAHVDDPWNGWAQALIRRRIPYVPVHVDDIGREAAELRVLILPNLAALSDAQAASIRSFVERGGSLIATGAASLCTERGTLRADFALADLFGAHLPAAHAFRDPARRTAWAREWHHTYVRLLPERRDQVNGPTAADLPPADTRREPRHEVLRGFDGTDILAFGGMLEPLDLDRGVEVPLTFVPPVPVAPAESVWMHEPSTTVPGLVLRQTAAGSRVAYLPADLDRRFAREYLPDQGDLLANLARWAAHDDLPFHIEGPGLIDCHLYRQPGRLILHVVNLTHAGTWRTPVHELITVGPWEVRLRIPAGVAADAVRPLVDVEQRIVARRDGAWLHFQLPPVRDHEVVVIA